jgi:hypothetical protein
MADDRPRRGPTSAACVFEVSATAGLWLIDQPTTRRLNTSSDGAVDLAFADRVLGDVGHHSRTTPLGSLRW